MPKFAVSIWLGKVGQLRCPLLVMRQLQSQPQISQRPTSKTPWKHVTKVFETEVLQPFGGPAQYLQAKLAEPAEEAGFLHWLWSTFPLDDKIYNLENPMPSAEEGQLGEQAPCKAHISMLGYSAMCTLKPMPSAHSARLLVQHLLMDGFVTSSQPLQIKHITPENLLTPPWVAVANGLPIHPFSLGYVKGMLRGSTILALLHMFWQDGQGLQLLEMFDKLKASCQAIYVHHIKHVSLQTSGCHFRAPSVALRTC